MAAMGERTPLVPRGYQSSSSSSVPWALPLGPTTDAAAGYAPFNPGFASVAASAAPGTAVAVGVNIPKFSQEELAELVSTSHTSIAFRWQVLLVIIFPILFIVTGVAHAAIDKKKLQEGAAITDLGVSAVECLVLAPVFLLIVGLHVWVRLFYRYPVLLPRHMGNLLNPEAQSTNIVAWFLRAGSQQYAILWAILLLCGALSVLVPITVVACQQAVTLPSQGAISSDPCLTAPFQALPQFEQANCQPCVDVAMYVTNTALYCTVGSVLVYAIVLAIAPSKKSLKRAKESLAELQSRYPLGNAMVVESELYARSVLEKYEEQQGKCRQRTKRLTVLCVSLAIFLGALSGSIVHKVRAKLYMYPDLPLNLAVVWLWITVAVAVVVILLALAPLSDLILYVVPSCIKQYVEPQVINFTAYINPVVRLGLAALNPTSPDREPVATFARAHSPMAPWPPKTPVEGYRYGDGGLPLGNSKEPLSRRSTYDGSGDALAQMARFGFFSSLANLDVNAIALEHDGVRSTAAKEATVFRLVVNLDGRSLTCPLDQVADAIAVLLAGESYLYNWVAARRYQQRAVLSCTLVPVGFLILIVFLIGIILFLAVLLIFLIPNQFQLFYVLEPAAILSLYISAYALISSTAVALRLISLVDQTAKQVSRSCPACMDPYFANTSVYSHVDLSRRTTCIR